METGTVKTLLFPCVCVCEGTKPSPSPSPSTSPLLLAKTPRYNPLITNHSLPGSHNTFHASVKLTKQLT